jgi:hypothetical protein
MGRWRRRNAPTLTVRQAVERRGSCSAPVDRVLLRSATLAGTAARGRPLRTLPRRDRVSPPAVSAARPRGLDRRAAPPARRDRERCPRRGRGGVMRPPHPKVPAALAYRRRAATAGVSLRRVPGRATHGLAVERSAPGRRVLPLHEPSSPRRAAHPPCQPGGSPSAGTSVAGGEPRARRRPAPHETGNAHTRAGRARPRAFQRSVSALVREPQTSQSELTAGQAHRRGATNRATSPCPLFQVRGRIRVASWCRSVGALEELFSRPLRVGARR